MATKTKKKVKYGSVRIWAEPKERLENLIREKAIRERRRVTEVEIASRAISAFCQKEERKLGLA